ncbi:MAG: hypothetical protein Q9171_004668, partial [Xanthocarpia ochracea]
MEAAERYTPTASTSRRRSNYQFPFLEGYNGPPPPDLATILARQEEHERQNPRPESESEAESTSSSLMSLDDEDDAIGNQPQTPSIVDAEEEVGPSTRPTVDEQLPADSIAQPPSITNAFPLMPDSTLEIPDFVFSAEDLEKARRTARKLRATYEEQKSAGRNRITASENALEKERLNNQELKRHLEDLRKVHDGCESKAKDAKVIARQLKGLQEISNLYDEGLEKLTASETALANEKKRNMELEKEIDVDRTESIGREKKLERHIDGLNRELGETSKFRSSFKKECERVKELNKELRDARTESQQLRAKNAEHVSNITNLNNRQKELEWESKTRNRKLSEVIAEYEKLLNDHNDQPSRQLKETIENSLLATRAATIDSTPTPAPLSHPNSTT